MQADVGERERAREKEIERKRMYGVCMVGVRPGLVRGCLGSTCTSLHGRNDVILLRHVSCLACSYIHIYKIFLPMYVSSVLEQRCLYP